MAKEKKKLGRPTKYTDLLAKEICDTIAVTSKGLNHLCREKEGWPNPDTIYLWRNIHPIFSEMYARAKQKQCDFLVEEILEIADDSSFDDIVTTDKNGEEKRTCNSEWVNRSRLRVDTRKWIAAKLAPRVYGTVLANNLVLNLNQDQDENISSIGELTERLLLERHTSH